jgi:squalene-hopene/tetraprenyl-beta-curcumene cyclase
MRTIALAALVLMGFAGWSTVTMGQSAESEPISDPGPNSADEPFAERFSWDAAATFLDSASLHWTKSRKCFTCHTNYSYLLARPLVSPDSAAHSEIRAELERLVEQRWADQGPRWDAEVVMSAAILAGHDAATSGKLHPITRTALGRMWTLQREDGGFDWLKCDWPPMESDDHYGATIALIGVGSAPEGYSHSPEARTGIDRLKSYLKQNPPPTLHHKGMLVWADARVEGILPREIRSAYVEELLAIQKADGGWALASMGDWTRADETPQDTETSDGYATGFLIYVLRQAGIGADHPALRRGVAWLKTHQRQSGRWYTRSLHKDNKHYISHAGSAFAVMALAACDETGAGRSASGP